MEENKKRMTTIIVVAFIVILITSDLVSALVATTVLGIMLFYVYNWENISRTQFYISLIGTLAWMIFFTLKYLIHFDDYSETRLIKESYYFLPPLLPFAAGIFTSWKWLGRWAILIPLIITVLVAMSLPLFFEYIFPAL